MGDSWWVHGSLMMDTWWSMMVTWGLHDGCMVVKWRLPEGYLMVTWCLPDGKLMVAWWLHVANMIGYRWLQHRNTGPIYLVYSLVFPHPKVGTFTQIFIYSTKCSSAKVVILTWICTFMRHSFARQGQKWQFSCYYALLCDIFYLRGPQRRRKKQHFYVNFYFIQIF